VEVVAAVVVVVRKYVVVYGVSVLRVVVVTGGIGATVEVLLVVVRTEVVLVVVVVRDEVVIDTVVVRLVVCTSEDAVVRGAVEVSVTVGLSAVVASVLPLSVVAAAVV
jgi:hypothetical protein